MREVGAPPFFVAQERIVINPRLMARDDLRVIPIDSVKSATLYDFGALLEIVLGPASPYEGRAIMIWSPMWAAERRCAERAYKAGVPEALTDPLPDSAIIANQEFLGECRKIIETIAARADKQRTMQ